MPSEHEESPSSILFDIVDQLERDRSSGGLLGLTQYLTRFPGHEAQVAREYLRLHDSSQPNAAAPLQAEPHASRARSAPSLHDSSKDLLKDSETPFTEHLRILASPVLRGTRLQRQGVIARGGMGVIHRVRDLELDRTLAVKAMILGPADQHVLAAARFLEEAQITAQLDHPGIVPIHETGVDGEGRLYFAMKLVRGRDLRTILDLAREGREGWTQPRMLSVMLKVCEAMAYAHTKGVIHRDLKPGNVMVGNFGEVYVMDWGLARALGRQDVHDIRLRAHDATASLRTERRQEREESADSPLVTMDGVIVGTPAYMSPEQARGEIHLLSPRSDVYSIGAMLYHMLTGETPFVPPGAHVSKYTVLARVIDGPPRPLHELAPDVPTELVAICEKAMARDLERRYPDTAALAEDLRCYLEGRVVQAHERGAIAELKKWVQRNKAFAGASAATIVALIAGFATSSNLWVQAAESAALATREANRADAEAFAARRRTEEVLRLSALQDLDDLLSAADKLWPVLPESAAALEQWLDGTHRLLGDLPRHERRLAELDQSQAIEDRWWRNQQAKIITGLKRLQDPEKGLIAGLSAEYGWGIERRLDFSRSVRERSVEGADAARRWNEASASIRDRGANPRYQGLVLTPQLGLLPIGLDPASGLWEFAHLQTGAPAEKKGDGRLAITPETGLVFVLVPGGTLELGMQKVDSSRSNYQPSSRQAPPLHMATLAPYFLSKYEMTQAQWSRFVGENPSDNSKGLEAPMRPVELVSWDECTRVVKRLGLCLPTVDQWERAARGETTTTWWTGQDAKSLDGAANLFDRKGLESWMGLFDEYEEWLDDGAITTATVGRYDPNPFGLYDVVGNVWEWCNSEQYKALVKDGYALHRGGGWGDLAIDAASAEWGTGPNSMKSPHLGLRPARAITED